MQEIVDTCDFFLGEGRRLYGQTVPSRDARQAAVHVPRRRSASSAIITAGNFPVAVPSWYLVPALLCGNTVVWKPAEYSAALRRRASPSCSSRRRAARRRAQHRARRRRRPPSTGSSRRWTQGWSTRSASPAPRAVGRAHRRAVRAAPADAVPGARRQEPDGRHAPTPTSTWPSRARCSPASARPGSAAPRSARSIVHESRARRVPRRGSTRAVRDAAIGDPTAATCCTGRCSTRSSPTGYEKYLGWIAAAPHACTAPTGIGRITADNPRDGFVGDPTPGCSTTRSIVDGVRPDDALFRSETFGPIVGVTTYRDPRRGDRAGQRARLRPVRRRSTPPTRRRCSRFRRGIRAGMVSVNNSTSGAEAHLPFGGNGKSGNGSRQCGHLGARPVHPLAGDELGLLRPAAEGADGRRRADAVVDLDYRLDI